MFAKKTKADLAFSTRCERNSNRRYQPGVVTNCEGWQLNAWNVKSGNISDSRTSILELDVTLVRDGYVSFHYFVSAENLFDGLIFQVRLQSMSADVSHHTFRSIKQIKM